MAGRGRGGEEVKGERMRANSDGEQQWIAMMVGREGRKREEEGEEGEGKGWSWGKKIAGERRKEIKGGGDVVRRRRGIDKEEKMTKGEDRYKGGGRKGKESKIGWEKRKRNEKKWRRKMKKKN